MKFVGIILLLLSCTFFSCDSGLPDQDSPVRKVTDLMRTAERNLAVYANKSLLLSGYIDVTSHPYNADPTGMKDATAAIQQALKDARDARMVCYLPPGRYLVSKTISGIQGTVEWDSWPYEGYSDPWVAFASFGYPNVLTGSPGKDRSVIVLADHAPGFDDPEQPKPVLHFWSRMEWGENIDRTLPQPSINFNQKITDIDIDLGKGNPGAVGINHQGAEGSVVENVNILAEGAFAGIQTAPGSGGGIYSVSVRGGRYGLYIRNKNTYRASQPSPLVAAVELTGQTEKSILYDGRGPLTLVGAVIEGAGILSDCPRSVNWNGAMNIVDAVIRMDDDGPAVRSNHSVVLENVYVENAATIVQIKKGWELPGRKDGWLHVRRCAVASGSRSGKWAGDSLRRDDLWIDARKVSDPYVETDTTRPLSLREFILKHSWPKPFPSGLVKGAVNVKDPPYLASGDGITDDLQAIQKAIDENEMVFIPGGTFAISGPLRLKSGTKIAGLGNVQTVITPTKEPGSFSDPDHPLALIETTDDADASTVLASMKLLVPVRNPCVYAICWRAGRRSVVRNVYPVRETSHPHATAMGIPMVRIEKSGGGKWFTNVLLHWWDQGPSYRHLRIDNTSEPLTFYMLEPQHGRGEYMVEIINSSNIDVFSVKSEGDYGVFSLSGCSNVRVFGYAGNGMPSPGYALFTVRDCNNFLLANINPQHKAYGHYGALGTYNDPS